MCRHSLLLFSLYLYYGGNSQFLYPLQFSRILALLTGVELIWVGILLVIIIFYFFFFWRVAWWTKASSLFCQPVFDILFDILYLYCAATFCFINRFDFTGQKAYVYIIAFVFKKQHKILKRKYYKLQNTFWAFLALSIYQMIISVIREQNQTKVLSSNRAPLYCVSWTSLFSQYGCNVEEQSGWGLLYIIFVLYK